MDDETLKDALRQSARNNIQWEKEQIAQGRNPNEFYETPTKTKIDQWNREQSVGPEYEAAKASYLKRRYNIDYTKKEGELKVEKDEETKVEEKQETKKGFKEKFRRKFIPTREEKMGDLEKEIKLQELKTKLTKNRSEEAKAKYAMKKMRNESGSMFSGFTKALPIPRPVRGDRRRREKPMRIGVTRGMSQNTSGLFRFNVREPQQQERTFKTNVTPQKTINTTGMFRFNPRVGKRPKIFGFNMRLRNKDKK